MKRIRYSMFVCLLVLTIDTGSVLCQTSEARRYFPHAVGNTWRWVSNIGGSTYDSWISNVSTGTDSAKYLFYNNGANPRYKLDTLGNVYQFITPTSPVLWFKISAQAGDSFYTWNDGYKVRVTTYNQTLFGNPTVLKVFTWYTNPGNYRYASQTLARDFGLIRSDADLGPIDEYVNGCIIDSIRYGSLVSVSEEGKAVPTGFALAQNYPNPFNPSTIIRFSLPVEMNVRLSILDVLGREMTTLLDEQLAAGQHSVTFDGEGLASGAYFYKIQAGSFVQARKMILAK